MLGTIIGDIVGSRFEWHNLKSKDFELFTDKCRPTDDSIMTLALAKAILDSEGKYNDLQDMAVLYMQEWGRAYPNAGYGGNFANWLVEEHPQPYKSYGNGAAMRVSPCGFAGVNMQEVKELAQKVTLPSHNHPEGLKGAEAVAVAIYLARTGRTLREIRAYIEKHYYKLNFTLDEIRPHYRFCESCQESVPQALEAFLESTSFEDAIRNAISIGGDSDTIGAIAGGIASAYYGVPEVLKRQVWTFLNPGQQDVIEEFEERFERGLIKNLGQ